METKDILAVLKDWLRAEYVGLIRLQGAAAPVESAAAGPAGSFSRRILLTEATGGPVWREVEARDRTAAHVGAGYVAAFPIDDGLYLYAWWADPADVPARRDIETAAFLLRRVVSAESLHTTRRLEARSAVRLARLYPDARLLPTPIGTVVYRSPRMAEAVRALELAAPDAEPVILIGETGVGKTLMAAGLHALSGRSGPFVHASAPAIVSRDLFRITLFGARGGAYTDLREDVEGLIEQAQGGTLFLDEIGDAAPGDQAAILACVETGRYFRVGSPEPRQADVRWVFATDRPQKVRPELLYRCLFTIEIPPLRERPEDIGPVLLFHADMPVEPGALELAERLPWPGNVRELAATARLAARLAGRERRTTVTRSDLEQARRLRSLDASRQSPG